MTQPSPNTPPAHRTSPHPELQALPHHGRRPRFHRRRRHLDRGRRGPGLHDDHRGALHRRARCLPRHRPGRCARHPPRPLRSRPAVTPPVGDGSARPAGRSPACAWSSSPASVPRPSRRCSSPTSAPTSSASTGPVSRSLPVPLPPEADLLRRGRPSVAPRPQAPRRPRDRARPRRAGRRAPRGLPARRRRAARARARTTASPATRGSSTAG